MQGYGGLSTELRQLVVKSSPSTSCWGAPGANCGGTHLSQKTGPSDEFQTVSYTHLTLPTKA